MSNCLHEDPGDSPASPTSPTSGDLLDTLSESLDPALRAERRIRDRSKQCYFLRDANAPIAHFIRTKIGRKSKRSEHFPWDAQTIPSFSLESMGDGDCVSPIPNTSLVDFVIALCRPPPPLLRRKNRLSMMSEGACLLHKTSL
eukprot:290662-Amphidinium_carterae.2